MRIYMERVYQSVGWVEQRFRPPRAGEWWCDGEGKTLIPSSGGILVVGWQEEFLEVNCRIEHLEERGGGGRPVAANIHRGAREAGRLVAERFGIQPKFTEGYRYLAAEIRPESMVTFIFRVWTWHPRFLELANQLLAEQQNGLVIKIRTFLVRPAVAEGAPPAVVPQAAARPARQSPQSHQQELELELRPLNYPPPFKGVVALDLGNTHTNLAALDATAVPKTSGIVLLPDLAFGREALNVHRMVTDSQPVESLLRIDTVTDVAAVAAAEDRSPEQLLSQPEAYAYRTGYSVWPFEEGPWGLVSNPKRSLAARSANFKHRVLTRSDDQFPVRHRLDGPCNYLLELPAGRPAELFVCRLLEGFQGLQAAAPQRLVVTYPSTYSASELATLREAVFRAWRMSQRATRTFQHIDEIIPLMIDEASAAAFFYLSRYVLEGPGGLQAFRWLYPEGFYLLVYDCGGATTDVAIVQAESPATGVLRLQVLGRTGLRDFGGDEITVATFLVLKAKLAEKIAERMARTFPRMPVVRKGAPYSRDLFDYLTNENILRDMDQLVPTDFEPGAGDAANMLREEITLRMWSWAEEVKKRLSLGQPLSDLPAIHEKLAEELCAAVSLSHRSPDIRELISQITVTREEIDSLVVDPIRRSVELCAKLAEAKLKHRLGQVDDVFVVGNGSLYPLIGDLLRKRFLGNPDQGVGFRASLFGLEGSFASEDLKNCVAKGAVIALALREAALGLTLEFDTDLCRRLPFSIGWHNAATNTCVPLYSEGERYEDLQPKVIDVPRDAAGQRPKWIRLMQRWPGAEYSPFLLFSFPDGVEGPVTITFDGEREQFVAVVEETGQQAVGEREIDPNIYRSAPQRGRIRLCRYGF
jgi:hypothetical protein